MTGGGANGLTCFSVKQQKFCELSYFLRRKPPWFKIFWDDIWPMTDFGPPILF